MYVLAFVGTSHRTHMNESSHMYKWVTSRTSMSRVTHMNESRGTRKRAMAHTWKSHVTHVNVQTGRHVCHMYVTCMYFPCCAGVTHTNKSCHVYEESHITRMKESGHKDERVMSHTRIWVTSSRTHTNNVTGVEGHMTRMVESWHNPPPVWTSNVTFTNDSHHTYEPAGNRGWEADGCALWAWAPQTTKLWSRPPYAAIWMNYVTQMEELCHPYESPRQQNFSRVPRMQPCRWVMLHMRMNHVTHMGQTCHIYEWVTSHIYMSRVTHMSVSCHRYGYVMLHIWMHHVTHVHESCYTSEWVTSH